MIEYNATCATCTYRDEDDRCTERRSAWHGWSVARKRGDCYFYRRRPPLPRINGGLEEPREGEVSADA